MPVEAHAPGFPTNEQGEVAKPRHYEWGKRFGATEVVVLVVGLD